MIEKKKTRQDFPRSIKNQTNIMMQNFLVTGRVGTCKNILMCFIIESLLEKNPGFNRRQMTSAFYLPTPRNQTIPMDAGYVASTMSHFSPQYQPFCNVYLCSNVGLPEMAYYDNRSYMTF